MSIIPIDKPKQTLLVLLSYWWYSLWLKMTMMLMPASTTLKIYVCKLQKRNTIHVFLDLLFCVPVYNIANL